MKILFSLIIFISTTSFAFSQSTPCLLDSKSAPALGRVKLGMTPKEVNKILGKKLKLTPKQVSFQLLSSETIDAALKKNDLTKSERRYYTLQKKLLSENDPAAKNLRDSADMEVFLRVYLDDFKTFYSYGVVDGEIERFFEGEIKEISFFKNRVYEITHRYIGIMSIGITDQERISILADFLNFPKEYLRVLPLDDLSSNPDKISSKCKDFEITALLTRKPDMFITIKSTAIEPLIEERVNKKAEEMYQKFKRKTNK